MDVLGEFQGRLSEVASFQAVGEAVLDAARETVGVSSASFLPLFPGAFSDVMPVGRSNQFSVEEMLEKARTAFPLIEREWQPLGAFFADSRRTLDMNAIFSWQGLDRMEVYQTFWRPFHVERQLISFMGTPERPLGVLCASRSRRERPFSEDARTSLDRLRGLTEKALSPIASSAMHGESSCILMALAQGLPMPCALLSASGRLLWLNEEAATRSGVHTTRIGVTCVLSRVTRPVAQWKDAVLECVKIGGGPTWSIGRLTVRMVECSQGTRVYLVVDPEPVSRRGTSLSSREWEVTQLAAHGYSVVNIAARLQIAEGTVRNHLKSVYRKLGISSRASLAAAILGW